MTGDLKKKFCEESAREMYTITRLMGGALEVKTSSPFLNGVIVIKSGEEYIVKNPYGEIKVNLELLAKVKFLCNTVECFPRVSPMSIMTSGSAHLRQMARPCRLLTSFLVTSWSGWVLLFCFYDKSDCVIVYQEACVDGIKSTTAVTIFARD